MYNCANLLLNNAATIIFMVSGLFQYIFTATSNFEKSSKHNESSISQQIVNKSVALTTMVQNTAKENRNKDPPLYKINRPSFFKYKCPSPGISPNTSAKKGFLT